MINIAKYFQTAENYEKTDILIHNAYRRNIICIKIKMSGWCA